MIMITKYIIAPVLRIGCEIFITVLTFFTNRYCDVYSQKAFMFCSLTSRKEPGYFVIWLHRALKLTFSILQAPNRSGEQSHAECKISG